MFYQQIQQIQAQKLSSNRKVANLQLIDPAIRNCALLFMFQARPCGRRPDNVESYRIVSGQDAIPHSWPWMVSILEYTNDEYMHFCGGSLVARNKVLTAAHCFKKIRDEKLQVKIGLHSRYDSDKDVEIRYVSRYDVNDKFDANSPVSQNDIALLTLDHFVDYSDVVSPVCIGEKGQLNTNSTCVVTGWGDTQYRGELSDYLQQLSKLIS